MTRRVPKFHSPLELLSKQCVSGIGKYKYGVENGPLPEHCRVIGNWFIISQILYKMAPTLKGPLT
jgi:hypothetical protein